MSAGKPIVAVIGAGVVGCSVAWEISRRGGSVVLLDECASPFQGTSRTGFGSLTPYSDPYFRGVARIHAARGVQLYRDSWIRDIATASGCIVSFQDLGLLKLCQTDADFAEGRAHAAELVANSYKAQALTVERIRAMEPNLLGDFVGGIWLEDEPWLDRDEYFEALTRALLAQPNINWRHSSKVLGIASDRSSLTLDIAGESTVSADFVVICTGLQSTNIGGLPSVPLLWVRGDAILVSSPDNQPLLKRHVYQSHGFITPRRDGQMLLGATYVSEKGIPSDYYRKNWERVEVSHIKSLIESNEAILPALRDCDLCRVWRGWRPTPPDNLPVVGPLKSEPRIIIATGFIGLGITMAPATAEAVTRYCVDSEESCFPESFDPMRFETTSKG